MQYRVLAYTSKNEFYVIELSKARKDQQVQSYIDDEGISTVDVE